MIFSKESCSRFVIDCVILDFAGAGFFDAQPATEKPPEPGQPRASLFGASAHDFSLSGVATASARSIRVISLTIAQDVTIDSISRSTK
jgi:hypothetical protein